MDKRKTMRKYMQEENKEESRMGITEHKKVYALNGRRKKRKENW
jgi:hypothetical protein